MEPTFELIAAVPWSQGGLQETTSTQMSPSGPRRARQPPRVVRGQGGALWLLAGEQVGPIVGGQWRPFSVAAGDLGALRSVVPLADGGVLALGVRGGLNALARLGAGGELRWRRTGEIDSQKLDLPSLRGQLGELMPGAPGHVYLSGARRCPTVAQVKIEDGATPVTVDLAGFDAPVFVEGEHLLRVLFEENHRVWARRPLAGGVEKKVAVDPALESALGAPRAGLPDGGALLLERDDFLWMSPDGKVAHRASIAGAVRDGDDLYVATREPTQLKVTRWHAGKPYPFKTLAPVSAKGKLVQVRNSITAAALVFEPGGRLEPSELVAFDAAGTPGTRREANADQVLAVEGLIDPLHPLVEPDGAIVLAGADPTGCYLVRLRVPAPR